MSAYLEAVLMKCHPHPTCLHKQSRIEFGLQRDGEIHNESLKILWPQECETLYGLTPVRDSQGTAAVKVLTRSAGKTLVKSYLNPGFLNLLDYGNGSSPPPTTYHQLMFQKT